MRPVLAGFIVLSGCAGLENAESSDLDQIAAAVIRAAAAESPEAPLSRVEVGLFEGHRNLFVAIRDWQAHWWGDFICFLYEGGEIRWVADLEEDDRPLEQSILAVRGVRLPGFPDPFVEVLGITHMGNGSCYLYQLKGRRLIPVLNTRAVDCNDHEGVVMRNDRLDIAYRDVDGDGAIDVEFTGVLEELSDNDRQKDPLRSRPCRKVFSWDSKTSQFLEDRRHREGFESHGQNDR